MGAAVWGGPEHTQSLFGLLFLEGHFSSHLGHFSSHFSCPQIWVITFELNMSEDWKSWGSKGTIMYARSQCDSGLVLKALASLFVSWETWGRFSSSPDTGALVHEK